MKLYIDDIRKEPPGWVLARTVTEAIRILATCDVEEVSIDHDISHAIGLDKKIVRPYPCSETFEPVAWFLCAVNFRGPITLHSANPAGAQKMKNILARNGIKARIVLGQPCNRLEDGI